MKTKIYKLSRIVLAALILLIGCSKDFLDTEPQGLISQNDFYKTDEDATAAILSCYNMLQALNNSPWSSSWMLKTFASDEIYSAGSKQGDQPAADEINQYKFGSNNAIIRDVYRMSYYTIFRANLVIDKFKPENDYKKAVIAEAKTIRAYMYMELVSLWGPVPLILHELASNEYQQPASTVAAIYTQIEKDLTDAIKDLPVKSAMKNTKPIAMDISRISKGAAQSFLGKALLYQQKYSASAAAFQLVIDSNEYDTIPDFSKILRKSSEFGKESVFEISYTSAKNNGWGTPNIWALPSRSALDNRIWQLCGPRGDQGFDGGSSGINGGWGFAYPTESIYNAFVNANDTLRLKFSILTESDLINKYNGRFRTSDTAKITSALPWGCSGMVRLKYGTWADETTPGSIAQPELNYGTNLRVIRYADVLLMAAEAYNQADQDGKALLLINQVRKRARCSALTVTGSELFNAIKLERRLELAFEGCRFQDLIRWGDAPTVLADQCKKIPSGKILGTQVLNPGKIVNNKWQSPYVTGGTIEYIDITGAGFKPYNILMPIPFDELKANKKLTPTPGY
jgi:hypothetical protein